MPSTKERWRTRIALAYEQREQRIAHAKQAFETTLVGAYDAGLSLDDIRDATGVSKNYITRVLRDHNVIMRSPGRRRIEEED